MDGMTTKALDLVQDFAQSFPVDEFLFPPWTAIIEAMTAGRGAIVIRDDPSGVQPVYLKFSSPSEQSDFSVKDIAAGKPLPQKILCFLILDLWTSSFVNSLIRQFVDSLNPLRMWQPSGRKQ